MSDEYLSQFEIVSETKRCSKCGEERFVDEYNKWRTVCRVCVNESYKKYYKENLEQRREKSRNYQRKNRENVQLKERKRKHYYDNKDRKKEHIKLMSKLYYEKNKEKCNKSSKMYRLNNIDGLKEKEKLYRNNPINKLRRNKRQTEKRQNDSAIRLYRSMSGGIYSCLKKSNHSKDGRKWESLVDYNIYELKDHLEKQFSPDITWDNYGSYWSVDHIKPICSFDITDSSCEDFKKCWSLENLRPLTREENIKKGGSYDFGNGVYLNRIGVKHECGN